MFMKLHLVLLVLSSGLAACDGMEVNSACEAALYDVDKTVESIAVDNPAPDVPPIDSDQWERKKNMITTHCVAGGTNNRLRHRDLQEEPMLLNDSSVMADSFVPAEEILLLNTVSVGVGAQPVVLDDAPQSTGLDSIVTLTALPSLISEPPLEMNFDAPCYPRPSTIDGFSQEGWQMVDFGDDQGVATSLSWDFSLFGTVYPAGSKMWVNINGNINFGENQYPGFTALGYPLQGVAMVAPFWGDADTSESQYTPDEPPFGSVWYKHFSNEKKFAVIWNEVGYYKKKNDKRNTFQLVISGGSDPTLGENNICFCYLDMQWTTGEASGGTSGLGGFSKERGPATVGANSGNGQSYAQFGRFDKIGTEYDGAFGDTDGVDYLDFRGTSLGLNGLCLDARTPNVPPICSGFPMNNTKNVACGESVDLSLVFSTPEPQQAIDVTLPAPASLPAGVSMTTTNGSMESMTVHFKWTPSRDQRGKTYEFDFVATDDFDPPSVLVKTLQIVVEDCPEKYCEPTQDPPICPAAGPACTPWRSPEHCPADESFPLLISNRHKEESAALSSGYWYPYLDDSTASYAYTVQEGYPTPKLYCCVTSIDEIGSSCFTNNDISLPTGYVIRAASYHSNMGVFVFPNGLDNMELISGMNMDLPTVINRLKDLPTPPEKILVEEFVSGPNGTLPAEYKFHMFNGELGAVTVVLNRGTDCSCYAEVDADFLRLDSHGCFVPGMPLGINNDGDQCYDIDKEAGKLDPYPVKGFDLCSDGIPKPAPCVWNDMKAIATSLSQDIGVYMRIDMFVDAENKVYVQEYSTNHNGGTRHCTAKEENGCINSCFLGQLWKSASVGNSLTYGGPLTAGPSCLIDWGTLDAPKHCASALGSTAPVSLPYISTC